MRRNFVLLMSRLNLPDDITGVSKKLIDILLKIFDDYTQEIRRNAADADVALQLPRPNFYVLRTAMHLLNILACSINGVDKLFIGKRAIPVAMSMIKTKIDLKEIDDVLEVSWSFLWNITGMKTNFFL